MEQFIEKTVNMDTLYGMAIQILVLFVYNFEEGAV